jgi:Domain of unknown function (DUF4276)
MTRHPVRIGFALEGNSDYDIIPILVRRYLTETYSEAAIELLTPLRPTERGNGFIKRLSYFARQLSQKNAVILVVVLDTDESAVGDRRKNILDAIKKCKLDGAAICISYGLAVKAMEAWLLSDVAALKKTFHSVQNVDEQKNPETIKDPKGVLNQLVQRMTDGVIKTYSDHASELAERVDLKKISTRCAHFSDFLKEIDTCMKPVLRQELKP